jgi:hypothetical protein
MTKRHFLGLESKHEPLAGREVFLRRFAKCFAAASLLIGLSLVGGMLGYRYVEGMAWIDAFANAAMILSGMGPMGTLETWGGKLFAGIYALYSGLAVIVAVSILLAPILHRLLHRFHIEGK